MFSVAGGVVTSTGTGAGVAVDVLFGVCRIGRGVGMGA